MKNSIVLSQACLQHEQKVRTNKNTKIVQGNMAKMQNIVQQLKSKSETLKFSVHPLRIDCPKSVYEFVFSCDAILIGASGKNSTCNFDVLDGATVGRIEMPSNREAVQVDTNGP